MKILFINKYFFRRGGSEASFFEEASLLEKHGQSVSHFAMAHPRNVPSPFSSYFISEVEFDEATSWSQKLKATNRMLFSWEARRKLAALLKAEKPDIAHLHNIYHHISPSILPVLKKAKIPVILTFHDYKFLCPVYTLYRRGGPCEECRNGRYHHCLVHRCSKNSYLKSGLAALEMYVHHAILHLYDRVDCFICPSLFLKNKMAGQIDVRKLFYLPNFIPDIPRPSPFPTGRKTILYFGRLSVEKGLRTLLAAMKGLDVRCLIAGEGPERPVLERIIGQYGLKQTALLGFQPAHALQALIRESAFTVLPSEWYENSPRAVLESFALGRAAVASHMGGLQELVKDRQTGLTFQAGNALDLREKITDLLSNPEKAEAMGRRARQFIQEELGPERHFKSLMKIYEIALAR